MMLTEEKLGQGYDPMRAAEAAVMPDDNDQVCSYCGEQLPCYECPPCYAEWAHTNDIWWQVVKHNEKVLGLIMNGADNAKLPRT